MDLSFPNPLPNVASIFSVMSDSLNPTAIKKEQKFYWQIFGALLLLTALTVAIAQVDLGSLGMNVFVGLLIACTKASLVGLFFMHLNHEKSLIYTILLYSAYFFLTLMGLTVLHLYDPTVFVNFGR